MVPSASSPLLAVAASPRLRDGFYHSHSGADKPMLQLLTRQPLAAGIQPLLDSWNLTTGCRPINIANRTVTERRLAICIDGASVHVGQNLRRDGNIRGRLRSTEPLGKVVELRATDLANSSHW